MKELMTYEALPVANEILAYFYKEFKPKIVGEVSPSLILCLSDPEYVATLWIFERFSCNLYSVMGDESLKVFELEAHEQSYKSDKPLDQGQWINIINDSAVSRLERVADTLKRHADFVIKKS